jgi:hypothetical protein
VRAALHRSALALVIFIACAPPALPAEPTSAATRAEMIRLIDSLEAQPHQSGARDMRAAVLAWLTEAPDVSVSICSDYLALGDISPDKPAGELMLQQPFAEARFILENPDKAQDEKAVHIVGVEGALRAYAAMKAEDATLEIPAMEALVKLQAAGKLPEHVAKAMKKCR